VEVIIRGYDPRDAADLADVFFRSVRQVTLADYTAAQVKAWAPQPRTAEWVHGEASDGRLVLVAANADDRPVAYIDLEPDGHIDRLFCAPEAVGQGIASRLYDAMEAAAREQGIRSLFTEASELARRLFERKGFTVIERQDLVIRGVAIHNYRMAKALSLTAPYLNWPGGRISPGLCFHRGRAPVPGGTLAGCVLLSGSGPGLPVPAWAGSTTEPWWSGSVSQPRTARRPRRRWRWWLRRSGSAAARSRWWQGREAG
jgi:putative acetyltransferase